MGSEGISEFAPYCCHGIDRFQPPIPHWTSLQLIGLHFRFSRVQFPSGSHAAFLPDKGFGLP